MAWWGRLGGRWGTCEGGKERGRVCGEGEGAGEAREGGVEGERGQQGTCWWVIIHGHYLEWLVQKQG